MKPIGRAVDRALRLLGVDRDVARADAVRVWSDAAVSVFGDDARSTHALRTDGETLVVTVPSAHWAGEVRLREGELVAAVKKLAPASPIARVRPVPATAHTPPR